MPAAALLSLSCKKRGINSVNYMPGKGYDRILKKVIRQEHAFTLVELLCVLVLLGMITAIAMPALQDLSQKRNLDIAARTLATDMRRCQQAAITTGRAHYIEFLLYHDQYHYRIGDGINANRERVKFPEGVSYQSIKTADTSGIPRLTFSVDGAPGNVGTVALKNKAGDSIYVIITPATGRVRISEKPVE